MKFKHEIDLFNVDFTQLKSELTAELLNEKVSLIEEEVRLLKLKEAETEIEKQELQLTSIKVASLNIHLFAAFEFKNI